LKAEMIRTGKHFTILLSLLLASATSAQAAISVQYSFAQSAIPYSGKTQSAQGAGDLTATTGSSGFVTTAATQIATVGDAFSISAFFEQSRSGWMSNYSRGLTQIAFTPSEDMRFSISGGISNLLGYTLLSSTIADSLAPDDFMLNQYGAQGAATFSPGNVNLWGYGSTQGTLHAGHEYIWTVEAYTDAELGFSNEAKFQTSSMALLLEPLVVTPASLAVPEPASIVVWLLLASVGVAASLRSRILRSKRV
jgi:hypothetical protein